jgi:hypothetical protein
MSDINLKLNADYFGRKLISEEGGSPEAIILVADDKHVVSLRTWNRTETGISEIFPNIRTARISVGKVMDPPDSGTFKIKAEDPDDVGVFYETAAISWSDDAVAFTTAVNAMLAQMASPFNITDASLPTPSCWVFRCGAGVEPFEFLLADNALVPSTFVRIRSYIQGNDTWYEVRLVRSPLAFTDLSSRVLPPPPSVEEIREGAPRDPGVTANTNEVQALTVPTDFQGTYYLKFDYRTTRLLGIEDGIEEIAAALNAMYTDGKTRFTVTNPEATKAYIEFIGPLAEAPQDEIEVLVNNFFPGPIVMDLQLKTAPMAYALRTVAELKVTLEVEVEVCPDGEDPLDPMVPGRNITLFQQEILVKREQIWEELATIPDIQWNEPPQPKDYIPFTPDQIITGDQHYLVTLGNGVNTVFVVVHNLGTSAAHVTIRENVDGGRQLQAGADYQIEYTTVNSVTITFTDIPAAAEMALVISTAGPISAFQAHTHTIAQIIGLQDKLDEFELRLATIEDRMPFTTPGTPTNPGGTRELQLPEFFETFPGRFPKDTVFKLEPTLPSRVGGLLPALHDPVVVGWSGSVLPAAALNQVWNFRRVVTYSFDPNVADSKHGTYVQFPNDNNTGTYQYVQFKSTGVDPAPPAGVNTGDTLTLVVIGSNATATQIATAVAALVTLGSLSLALVGATLQVHSTNFTQLPYTNGDQGSSFVDSGQYITINGGLGRKSRTLKIGADSFFGYDGRFFYVVERERRTVTTKDSYFPADFTKQLWLLAINEKMFRPGDTLEVTFKVGLQVLKALTQCQYLLEIQVGTVPQQTTPGSAVGVNLSDVVWDKDPMVSQRIILTSTKQEHDFGVSIRRSLTDTIAGDCLVYGVWEAALANSLPASSNFVLRARLVQFDTENSVADPRGVIHVAATDISAEIES